MEFLTSGSVRGGVLYLRNRKRMEAALSHWRDCAVTVTITKAYATRSKPQNDYYHAVCVELVASHTGYTHLEAHELLKALHLPRESAAKGLNGRLLGDYVIGGSTTKLNKLEFIDYLERIVQWAAETLDVVIPDPDPEWRANAELELEVEPDGETNTDRESDCATPTGDRRVGTHDCQA
jgi:hypothetical protein